ncbi:MAG: (2Fe-2S)-binding protein [Cupriavidus sp.]|nr:(2Fe-2S)-binding protein [Cupriavidus sp.]NUT14340.1 (2Fe-2S)-binding protein [Cupriavidus sp.]
MPTNDHAAGAPLFMAVETDRSSTVTLTFEGQPLKAPAGATVAAALLLNGVAPFRTTPVTSAPRAPYCMMGVCFECLVEIDGKPGRQACLTAVRDGMVIKRQQGASAIAIQEEVEA